MEEIENEEQYDDEDQGEQEYEQVKEQEAMFHEESQEVIYGVSYCMGFQQFSERANITMYTFRAVQRREFAPLFLYLSIKLFQILSCFL